MARWLNWLERPVHTREVESSSLSLAMLSKIMYNALRSNKAGAYAPAFISIFMGLSKSFDRIIIGAGLYGLYAAAFCAKRGEHVLVLEKDPEAFKRATYINQARVHMGYHYPRSLSTATKSAGYFRRFCDDFEFCIHKDFTQVYATSSRFSWTNAEQFSSFCDAAGIMCEEVSVSKYFNPDVCDGAFVTEEYTYDAMELKDHYLKVLGALGNVQIVYNAFITDIFCNEMNSSYELRLSDGSCYEGHFLLNATYASANQIISMVRGIDKDLFDLKYELCEIILTKPCDIMEKVGITVMDGPFFSIMPFGHTGLHSLTAVAFTPHVTSYDDVPVFNCQDRVSESVCSRKSLGNCSDCEQKPESAWPYMDHLARKYLLPQYDYEYVSSLFSMKPILKSSEVDDSRPTAIRYNHRNPDMVSVLSGKINTVYDLDDFLQ